MAGTTVSSVPGAKTTQKAAKAGAAKCTRSRGDENGRNEAVWKASQVSGGTKVAVMAEGAEVRRCHNAGAAKR